MGVRGLNKFLQVRCKNVINKKLLFSLKNKTIAIDANNYLYKFLTYDELIPNLYEFCILMKYYNIKPIFVFDGEAPPEKMKIIEKRRERRKNAQEKYEILLEMSSKNNKKMEELKKEAIYLSNQLIKESKILLKLLNISVLIAPGEADEYLCKMVKTCEAYAAMSEDMDLFVYGCPRVIRYVSILTHSCVIYEIESILKQLNITQDEFTMLCIMCGTDYNKKINNIYLNYNSFLKFKNSNESEGDFTNYVESNYNISNLNFTNIKKLFEININSNATESSIKPEKDTYLKSFLEKYNFIFP